MKSVSGNKRQYVSTGTVDVHIQRIQDESTFAIYGVLGATHKGWVDISDDVKEGDKVIDSDSREFRVVAVNNQDFGLAVHKELILIKLDA